MDVGRAFVSGVAAAGLMAALLAFGRIYGLGVDLEMVLGSFVTGGLGPWTWVVGFLVHLHIGGVLGLAYAFGFHRLTRRAGWDSGLALAAVHLLAAGILLGLLPLVHPLVPEPLGGPGAFLSAGGLPGVVAFALVHAVYGMAVGELYAPPLRVRRTT